MKIVKTIVTLKCDRCAFTRESSDKYETLPKIVCTTGNGFNTFSLDLCDTCFTRVFNQLSLKQPPD